MQNNVVYFSQCFKKLIIMIYLHLPLVSGYNKRNVNAMEQCSEVTVSGFKPLISGHEDVIY